MNVIASVCGVDWTLLGVSSVTSIKSWLPVILVNAPPHNQDLRIKLKLGHFARKLCITITDRMHGRPGRFNPSASQPVSQAEQLPHQVSCVFATSRSFIEQDEVSLDL